MKEKVIFTILLLVIFVFALFLRVYFSYQKVFSEPIKYVADDGVYHMRLVENELLGNHFPHRIYFDPYTYFPYGTYHFFAPLYDQLLVGIIWLISFGKPTLALINKISPFYPAVLGSLTIFPVYFIAKKMWGRKSALLSAFLIAISPPFLFRSLLGATDHHVAEVLFSTLAMMFLIFALKTRNKTEKKIFENSSMINKIETELKNNKKFWLFTILTGFSLGLYFLAWIGALLFLFIIFVFITLFYLIEYFSDRIHNWILILGIIIFLITLIMISPFFGHPDLFHANLYNIQHLEILIFGILSFLFVGLLGNSIKKRRLNKWFLPIFLVLTVVLILIILKIVSAPLFEGIIKILKSIKTGLVPHELAREIIAEMQPLTWQGAIDNFSTLFYLFLIALAIIFYEFIKKKKPEYLLIFVWTLIILLITGIIPFFGQMRFTYYLSVNVSLLVSFLIVKSFRFGWQGLKIAQEFPPKSIYRFYILIGSILIIFNIVFSLIFPYPLNIGKSSPQNLPEIFQSAIQIAKAGPFTFHDDWYEALEWLKENTPDPGINYYAFYQDPGVNRETGVINPYSYPQESYGVLARWDVGHMITYYAHRIPNANPFQEGLGRKTEKGIEPGEITFFLEEDEQKAIGYLEDLNTRYIITDYDSANPEGVFISKVKWEQGNLQGYTADTNNNNDVKKVSKYDNSMIARLHILDGRELQNKEMNFYIKPLDHFRLIYESKTTMAFPRQEPGDVIKAVKIFEYVKGARIIGQTEPDTEVSLATEITTNQDRKFVYQKSIIARDGYFEFFAPYSTVREEKKLSKKTDYEVIATPYKLKIGDNEREINVSEEEVLNGRIIKI